MARHPEHQSNLPPFIRSGLAKIIEFINKIPRYQIEGQENINQAKEHLDRGGSLTVYFAPHTAIHDSFIVTRFITEHLLGADQRYPFGWILTAAFTGEFEHIDTVPLVHLIVDSYAEGRLELFSVVQPRSIRDLQAEIDQGNEAYVEILTAANQFNRETSRAAKNFLNQDGVILGISPETTRNKLKPPHAYGLQRAEPATKFYFRPTNATPHLALPVTIKGARSYKIWRPDNAIITAGPLVSYAQAKEIANHHQWSPQAIEYYGWDRPDSPFPVSFTVIDAFMHHLVSQTNLEILHPDVPPEGVYSPQNIIKVR